MCITPASRIIAIAGESWGTSEMWCTTYTSARPIPRPRLANDLKTEATPKSVLDAQKAAQTGGKVPAYLTNQIANYQAALDRLGG